MELEEIVRCITINEVSQKSYDSQIVKETYFAVL